MNITLFFFGGDLPSDGVRLISAILKKDSHSVQSVFIPHHILACLTPDQLNELHTVLRSSQLVLMSVYSAYANLVGRVADFIRREYPGLMIVWGGPHCIAAPEVALRHADAVCFGEADDILSSFVSQYAGGDSRYLATPNMAFRADGKTIVNKPAAPVAKIDELPFYDYDTGGSYVLTDKLNPLSPDLMARYTSDYPHYGYKTLSVLTTRGCPHQCSYCNNCRYVALFGKNALRRQSVSRFMDELESILKRHDVFKAIFFGDDDFMIRPLAELEEFAARYKKTVGLPFSICVSAHTFTKEKFSVLLDAGLAIMILGLQSASKRVLKEVYNRNISPEKIMTIARCVEDMTKGSDFQLLIDFIFDNPYETQEDLLETYRYAVELPKKNVRIQVWKLSFFPGTPIYERAARDNFISGCDDSDFTLFVRRLKYQYNYPMMLLLIVKRHAIRAAVPRFVLRFLASPGVVALVNLVAPPSVIKSVIVPAIFSAKDRFISIPGLVKKDLIGRRP